MADPVFIDCPANIWTKVATNVTAGQIHKKSEQPQEYLHTYRDAGGTAPASDTAGREEGVRIFIDGNISEQIINSFAIDVYVFPIGADGKVRADL